MQKDYKSISFAILKNMFEYQDKNGGQKGSRRGWVQLLRPHPFCMDPLFGIKSANNLESYERTFNNKIKQSRSQGIQWNRVKINKRKKNEKMGILCEPQVLKTNIVIMHFQPTNKFRFRGWLKWPYNCVDHSVEF